MGKPGTKLARLKNVLTAEGNGPHSNNTDSLLASYCRELCEASEPEEAYRLAIPLEHRKRFGQFFTPFSIAQLMGEWIREINPLTILDPAVGPGIFPRVLSELCPDALITCIDCDRVAVNAAQASFGQHDKIVFIEQDFLVWEDERLFDAAIANPPYLRHHDLHYAFDIFYFIGKKNHVLLSRLSNVYVLFILEICRRLRVGGRAAVIVPGEWVNANFGDKLKFWLISRGLLHTLMYFSHASSQFEDALTTASIMLLEKPRDNKGRKSVRTIFVQDDCPLDKIRCALAGQPIDNSNVVVQRFSPERLLDEKKWNHLLRHGHTEALPGFVPLKDLADTRRGIATGCNSFFHLSPSAANGLRLRSQNLTPCIGRALDVAGTIFSHEDFDELVARDGRAYLFDMQAEPDEAESSYITKGESDKVHERYLCAARKGKWYAMERRPPSAIWAAVFGRTGLRFIHNAASIANLTTFHCIYPKSDTPDFAAALTVCLNSRLVQDRARRQHRVYGGGLLKVEPKDLLDVEIPDLRKVASQTLHELELLLTGLNVAVRAGTNLEQVYDQLDSRVEDAAQEAAQLRQQSLLQTIAIDSQLSADRLHISIVPP
jgi:adenine-specific DNA-methyltransferase